MLQTQEKLLPALDSGSHINARHKLRLEASAERTLEGGGSMPLLGASAAAPPHIWKEQGQPERFLLSSWEDRGSS
jgi:hypothetical protein